MKLMIAQSMCQPGSLDRATVTASVHGREPGVESLRAQDEAGVDRMSGTVLLVSEDPEAGRLGADTLGHAGVDVVLVGSAREALRRWEQAGCDLIVADVCDHRDGLDLCRRLRARAVNPILLLCPHGNEDRAVAAYAAGADECIPKPVSPAILLAKVRAWLRHQWTLRAESLDPLEAGGLRLEPARREVSTAQGSALRLTVLEFRLLYQLMSHPGQVLPPDVLVPRVWGPGGGGDRRLLRHVVHNLRRKIEPDPRRPRTIRTVRGQGYAFLPERDGRAPLPAGHGDCGPSPPVAGGTETATQSGELRPVATASVTGL